MIPLFLTIGATVAGSLGYVYFMVKKPKTKPKRKSKPQIPEPIKEEPKLKMEDFPIA
jgi:flagellar basal body-associated protein FliL